MAETVRLSFDVAGRELASPIRNARHVVLQSAGADIEMRANNSGWILLTRGSRISLVDGAELSDIRFRSPVEQEVAIGFDVITDGGLEVLGSVQLENTDELREVQINALAQAAFRDAVAGALNDVLVGALDAVRVAIEDSNVGNAPVETSTLPNILVAQNATRLRASDIQRESVTVFNPQDNPTIYLASGDAVSVGGGIPVAPGIAFTWPGGGELWAVSTGEATVKLFETIQVAE